MQIIIQTKLKDYLALTKYEAYIVLTLPNDVIRGKVIIWHNSKNYLKQ